MIKSVHKPLRIIIIWKKESVKKSQAIDSRFPSLLNGFYFLMGQWALNNTSDRQRLGHSTTIAYEGQIESRKKKHTYSMMSPEQITITLNILR